MSEPQEERTVPLNVVRFRSIVTAIISSLATAIIMTALSIWYTNRVDRESDRENNAVVERLRRADRSWCTLLGRLDKQSRENPPQTESGRAYAADITKILTDLGCPRLE
jgi:hypothetical protein